MISRLKNLLRSRRGSAMVEFAIGASLLATVFAGTFQWGYSFYRYNALLAAVNAGARFAAFRPYDSLSTTPSGNFQTAVKNVVVYGDPAGGTTPIVPGLQTSHVRVTAEFTNGVPSAVKVYITGFTYSALFRTVTLTNKPMVRYPYQSLWQPATPGA